MKKVIKDVFLKLTELHELHNDLPFLPEKMEIDKVRKLVDNLDNKIEYVIPKKT